MSKGLGLIEQRVLFLLPDAPHGHADSVTLTAMVYRVSIPDEYGPSGTRYLHHLVTNEQRVAVRRALASLKRKGLVEDLGVEWARGRRHWRIVPDILERLAAGAKPRTSLFRTLVADGLRDSHPLLSDQIRYLIDLPSGRRAREAADLNASIARRARRLQWEAEMDAAEAVSRTIHPAPDALR